MAYSLFDWRKRSCLRFFIIAAIWHSVLLLVRSQCPNKCNSRGKCNTEGVCICDSSYKVAPDCSQSKRYQFIYSCYILRPLPKLLGKCPYDFAWADKAYEENIAHTTAECSSQGICDRSTVSTQSWAFLKSILLLSHQGECKCFSGFEGVACERGFKYVLYRFLQYNRKFSPFLQRNAIVTNMDDAQQSKL